MLHHQLWQHSVQPSRAGYIHRPITTEGEPLSQVVRPCTTETTSVRESRPMPPAGRYEGRAPERTFFTYDRASSFIQRVKHLDIASLWLAYEHKAVGAWSHRRAWGERGGDSKAETSNVGIRRLCHRPWVTCSPTPPLVGSECWPVGECLGGLWLAESQENGCPFFFFSFSPFLFVRGDRGSRMTRWPYSAYR